MDQTMNSMRCSLSKSSLLFLTNFKRPNIKSNSRKESTNDKLFLIHTFKYILFIFCALHIHIYVKHLITINV